MRAILHDVARCRGCMECVEICAHENHLVEPDDTMVRFEPGDLSQRRFTTLARVGNGSFVRRHCLHCVEPASTTPRCTATGTSCSGSRTTGSPPNPTATSRRSGARRRWAAPASSSSRTRTSASSGPRPSARRPSPT